ncbi:MAG: RDD family protein [Gemmatimonadota bacterium]|nr:RDD family protein [Gemmatimonadota bacterium]
MTHRAPCTTCGANSRLDSDWCHICRTHLSNPRLGRLASPGKRLGAYLLDGFIPVLVLVFVVAFGGLFGGLLDLGGASAETTTSMVMLVIWGVFAAYLALSLVLFCRGTTPGKLLLHMRVIRQDESTAGFLTMLGREWIGKALSGLLGGLGYIWILIDRDNQGWHDKLVATYVVEA